MRGWLRTWWAWLLVWLGKKPSAPDVPPPAQVDEPLYHTLDKGQDAAVTKGPRYCNGRRR